MLIGFAGKAATGKTTAANFLTEILNAPTRIVPMALLLREEVEAFLRASGADTAVPLLYGDQDDKVRVFHVDTRRATAACVRWPEFVAENRDLQERPEETAVTVRRILQWWGTEYRRSADPDYWTKAWAARVEEIDPEQIHILVDDVRFINELHTLKDHGGLIVKIERPGFDGANNHSSETSLDGYDDWDRVIRNDGTLEEFRAKIAALAAQLRQR